MFVFATDSEDGGDQHTLVHKRTSKNTMSNAATKSILASIPETTSTSFSTTDTSFTSTSSEGTTDVDESFGALSPYKPRFLAPLDLVEAVTDPKTPISHAMDAICKLHAWFIEAPETEIAIYGSQIESKGIPKLLGFLKANRKDNQCVCEVVALLRRFAVHPEIDAIAFVQSDAIDVLVEALLSYTSSTDQDACLFRTLWNCLMDIVLSSTVVAYFRNSSAPKKGRNGSVQQEDTKRNHQRSRLVSAIDLCLDRAGEDMSIPWMAQIFDTLRMLLRTDEAITSPTGVSVFTRPNGSVRSALFERQIVTKTQNLLRLHHHSLFLDEYEMVCLRAISFFWYCLEDRKDELSEQLDVCLLEKFVLTAMEEYPRSDYLQETGDSILNKISQRGGPSSQSPKVTLQDLWHCTGTKSPEPEFLESSQMSLMANKDDTEEGNSAAATLLSWTMWIKSMLSQPCVCVEDIVVRDQ